MKFTRGEITLIVMAAALTIGLLVFSVIRDSGGRIR